MEHVLLTLGDVSSALLYLHKLRICHRNLKLTNVLLRRSKSDPRGYVAKVGWVLEGKGTFNQ